MVFSTHTHSSNTATNRHCKQTTLGSGTVAWHCSEGGRIDGKLKRALKRALIKRNRATINTCEERGLSPLIEFTHCRLIYYGSTFAGHHVVSDYMETEPN